MFSTDQQVGSADHCHCNPGWIDIFSICHNSDGKQVEIWKIMSWPIKLVPDPSYFHPTFIGYSKSSVHA